MTLRTSVLALLVASVVLVGPVATSLAESPEDILDRIHALQKRHDPQSLISYARELIDGIPVNDDNPLRVSDYVGARAAIEEAARSPGQFQMSAEVILAKMLLRGQGGPADRSRAIDLLERAAAAGVGEAAYLLGEEFQADPAREAEAKTYYQMALRLGYARAGLALATMTSTVDPQAAKDVEYLAISLLEAQAKEGRASAAMAIGEYFAMDAADPLSQTRALEWFERAATLGDTEGVLSAARLQADPSSPLYNPRGAGQLYLRAADAGALEAALAIVVDHDGTNSLGVSDKDAKRWGDLVLDTDDVKAVLVYAGLRSVSEERRKDIVNKLFDELSEESANVAGMLSLGARLKDGELIEPDLERALSLFRRAAKLGSDDGALRTAETLLREPSLRTTEGVRDAFGNVRDIAERGNPEAEVLMGDFFAVGFGTSVDREGAVDWYLKAAEHDSTEGMTSLAQLYLASGNHETRQLALPWLVRAASLGNVESQLELADAYARGDIVDRDVFKAIEAYRVALAGNASGALDALANVYLRIGGPGAVAEAQEVYEGAIEKKYPEAEVKYGTFLVQTGQAVKAVKYLDLAQNAGNFDVALLLQSIYFHGLAGEVDKSSGRAWMDRAIESVDGTAARTVALASALVATGETDYMQRGIELLTDLDKRGDGEAARQLAVAYLNGTAVERDTERALDLFDRAIDAGNTAAEVDLGDAYMNGNGVPVQLDRAVSLFEDVVTKSPGNAAANLRLGNIYARGLVGEPDAARAAPYYDAAANAGSTSAQRAIGLQYLWGDGVPQSATEAEYWLMAAANNGAGNAYFDLATLKSAGMGTDIAADSAFAYNYEAALRAHVPAMIEVGIALIQGFGVPVDTLAGTTWLKRAAELGSNIAMYDLYQVYSSGYGVTQDDGEANRWLTAAASAGNGSALFRQALALLAKKDDASKQAAIVLLQKAAMVEHNQSKKLLVKMGLLSPSDADDVAQAEEGDGYDG